MVRKLLIPKEVEYFLVRLCDCQQVKQNSFRRFVVLPTCVCVCVCVCVCGRRGGVDQTLLALMNF